MSIVRMRKVFRNKLRVKAGKRHIPLPSPAELVFYLIIFIFVVGAYTYFGGPSRSGQGSQGAAQGRMTPVVARVNGEKIPRELFEANMAMQRERMPEMDPTQERWMKSGLLTQLIDGIVMRQAVKKEHIKVSGADLAREKDTQIQQIMDQRFPEQRELKHYLKKKNLTLDKYKSDLRKEAFKDTDALRQQVAEKKLQEQIESKVTMTDEQLKDSFAEVRASHILLDPKKCAEQAAKQAKPGQAAPAVDGDAIAKKKAEELLAQIKAGADFAKLAKDNSVCPSAAKGGDLDWFTRDRMTPAFADAAFKLQVGQVSDVVKTDFGYHIIKVTGRRDNLPKDFEKNKQMLRDSALAQAKSKAWGEYKEKLTKEAQIEVFDPELLAYRLMDEGKQPEAMLKLQEAVKMNPSNGSAIWELSQLYKEQKNIAEATKLVDQLTALPEGAASPRVHLELGDLYGAQKDRAKALAQYKEAFDRASGYTTANFGTNMQVEGKLKAMGDTTLTPQVSKWLADYRAQQPANPMGGFGNMGNFQIQ
ncbi:MAG: peptidylprolyl isomerase [Armatimonadia bacterium]